MVQKSYTTVRPDSGCPLDADSFTTSVEPPPSDCSPAVLAAVLTSEPSARKPVETRRHASTQRHRPQTDRTVPRKGSYRFPLIALLIIPSSPLYSSSDLKSASSIYHS